MSVFDLTGKVAIVTGANTGIGQGIALSLAEAGADIAVVGRTAPTETEAKVKGLGRRFLPLEFAYPGYWLPIAAQQFTHPSSRTGFAQQLIALAAQHMT